MFNAPPPLSNTKNKHLAERENSRTNIQESNNSLSNDRLTDGQWAVKAIFMYDTCLQSSVNFAVVVQLTVTSRSTYGIIPIPLIYITKYTKTST